MDAKRELLSIGKKRKVEAELQSGTALEALNRLFKEVEVSL
jgi:hypothetical protein